MSESTSTPARTRFAPSPTGLPHVGNIRTALYSWLLARRTGGRFLFRLEDTDRDRYDPASEQALADALAWLGMDYDEGPGIGGPYGPYVQSQRLEEYQEVARQLIESGSAYRCYCSKERVQEVREARQQANIHPYGYDGHCRALHGDERRRLEESGAPSVVRFAVPPEGETEFHDLVRGRIVYRNQELDDHVLLKSDGFPTYHLAHMVDDRAMKVTHVIRAEEWLPSTPRHVLQHRALGWETPNYVHPGLLHGRDPQTGKVSKFGKRHGAAFVLEYREMGYLPEAMVNFLALLGWAPGGDREIMDRDELIRLFSVEGINPSPSVFDMEKLNWMNGVYIRALPEEELVRRCLPYLQKAGLVGEAPDPATLAYLTRILSLERERMKTLAEAPELTEFFFGEQPRYEEAAVKKWLQRPGARSVLDTVSRRLQSAPAWELEQVEGSVRAAIDELGVKAGEVIHPTRVAVTGRTVGPGLFETLWALGPDRVERRLRHAREQLAA